MEEQSLHKYTIIFNPQVNSNRENYSRLLGLKIKIEYDFTVMLIIVYDKYANN